MNSAIDANLTPTAAFARLRDAVVANQPRADLDDLYRVALLAADCHRGQHRKSGDQYVTHPLIVASYVAEWGYSIDCVQAAILHDIIDGGWSPEVLRASVGARVVALVEASTALNSGTDITAMLATSDPAAELFAHEVLAIRVADRLHNARTWFFVPRAKARLKAQETLDRFVLFADVVGPRAVGAELRSLAERELRSSETRHGVPVRAGLAPASTPDAGRSKALMLWAVGRLPERERERYYSEWAAEIAVIKSPWRRMCFAIGTVWAARSIRRLG